MADPTQTPSPMSASSRSRGETAARSPTSRGFLEWAARVVRVEARFVLNGWPAKRVLGLDEDDIVQHVLLLFVDRHAYEQHDPARGSMGTFLRQYARSRILELARMQRRRVELGDAVYASSFDPETLVAGHPSAEETILSRDELRHFDAFLRARLPLERHSWIAPLFLDGISNAEFASREGVSPNAVGCFKHRVRSLCWEFTSRHEEETR